MARIRSIKPEFCTSAQVADCSTTSRLLFVEMWMFCDDYGNHPANLRQLKIECFPADPFTIEDMRVMVDELIAAGLLVEYQPDEGDAKYWHVTGWHHQKIEKKVQKWPPFRGCDSSTSRRPVVEPSSTSRRPLQTGEDRIGGDRRGSLGEERSKETPLARSKESRPPVASRPRPSPAKFVPPTLEEVRTHIAERKSAVNPETFHAHYEANGWVQGKGKPIRDWKAAVITWERNGLNNGATPGKYQPMPENF